MNSIQKLSAVTLLLPLLCGGVPAASAMAAAPPSAKSATGGQQAPAFSIKTLDGKVVNSSQLAGRPYIVNFFASWCPPCREELPGMVALQKKYQKQGFTFVGVAFRDRQAEVTDFLWEMGVDYPVGMTTPELEAAFGKLLAGGKIRAIPATFVIGRNGKVLNAVSGGLTKADFESLIIKAIGTKPSK